MRGWMRRVVVLYVGVFGEVGVWMCVWYGVCDMVCVSLRANFLGAEGGAAMAGAVQHLTSLTTLEYV